MKQQPICIYHGNCADGFGAAWAVWKKFPDAEFYAGIHQVEPPDVSDADVIIVDFSYKRPVLLEMAEKARSIVVLDHHKSAAEDLAGFERPADEIEDCWHEAAMIADTNAAGGLYIRTLFDMNRSGAGITWDYIHQGAPRPALLNHIEDRDLWKFELPQTREIQAALFSYPYEFELWDELIDEFEGDVLATDSKHGPVTRLAMEGQAIERKHHKDVAELVAVTKRAMTIGGHQVPVASLPYTLVSDAAHMMAEGRPFAACYWDTEFGRSFGLRSTADGEDVSEIAKQYGGGGHKNAAGFSVPRDHELAQA